MQIGAKLQNIISLMKLLLLLILTVAAVYFVWGNPHVVEGNFRKPFEGSNFSGFGASCIAALWAFSGWYAHAPLLLLPDGFFIYFCFPYLL